MISVRVKKSIIGNIFIILFLIFYSLSSSAATYSGEWADVSYYFSWMEENGNWHEWIELTNETEQILYQDLTLKIGQPVRCKIQVLTHIKSAISIWITEPGTAGTESYIVIDGANHDEPIDFYINETGRILWLDPETEIEYIWILQTNDRWTGTRSPLSAFCKVGDTSTLTEDIKMTKSFANPYIENEEWTGPSYEPDNNNDNNGNDASNGNGDNNGSNKDNTPGFELILLIASLLATILILKKRGKW